MLSIYPACFYKEKEGNYSVIFPVLGIATCGDTIDEAMEMAIDCLAGYLYDAKIAKKKFPNRLQWKILILMRNMMNMKRHLSIW